MRTGHPAPWMNGIGNGWRLPAAIRKQRTWSLQARFMICWTLWHCLSFIIQTLLTRQIMNGILSQIGSGMCMRPLIDSIWISRCTIPSGKKSWIPSKIWSIAIPFRGNTMRYGWEQTKRFSILMRPLWFWKNVRKCSGKSTRENVPSILLST